MPPTRCARWAARATSRFPCSSSAGRPARRPPWSRARRCSMPYAAACAATSRAGVAASRWPSRRCRGACSGSCTCATRSPSTTSRTRCATRSARTTSTVAAAERRRRRGVLRTSWSRRQYVKKTDIVRYGPHRTNVADIWHRADLPRDGKAPVLLQVPGGAWAIGMRRPQAYPLMSHMAERGWICVSMAYRVSPAQHVARTHRRRQARAGLGQGEHRRVRR